MSRAPYFFGQRPYMWSCEPESNRRPVHYEGTALPSELPQQTGDRCGDRTRDFFRDREALSH